MNDQEKTKEELINELQELREAHHALKVSAEADSITQKQTMEAFKASEERFQLLFNKAPLGYQSLDFDGNFIEVNQQWLETLGYEREEVMGKWFGDFLTPAFKDGFRKRFPIFKERGKIHSEFEMIHKNGSVLFIAFDGRIGYDVKGDFKQTHCILQDITEKKHAEKALIESEEKYRLLHENAGIGIGYYKVDGTIISYNNIAARNMNGVPEDFNGKSIYDLFPNSDAEFYHERIKKAVVSEMPVVYEDEVDLPTGNKYFLSTYTRITNADGEIEGIQILSQDITDRRQAEAALKESEENLSITLHSIGDAVISTDKNGLIIQMNPVAETLCGWNLTEASGKPLAEVFTIINAETRQTVADPVAKVLEKGEIVGLANHTILVSRNGTEYQISDSAAPIKNKAGEITGVVLVFSDVTGSYIAQKQIKESEERYRSLLNNLEAGIVVHASDTSITMNNHRASELLGLTDDQMRGKSAIDPAWKFIHEDNTPLTLPEYPVNRIVTGKKPIKNQVLGIHQPTKNDIVWVTVNGFPVLDTKGEITEIVISFIDITERKLAELLIQEKTEEIEAQNEEYQQINEELNQTNQELAAANKRTEESEAIIKASMENSQAGIIIAEYPTGKMKYANKAALLIRGKEYDEIVKDIDVDKYVSSWQIFHFDGTPFKNDETPLARAILYGETYSCEGIIRRDNNEDRYVWANAAPIYNAQGIQTSAIVVFLDITDRIQAEGKLKLLEQQSRAWLENSPACTKIVDLDFNLQFMSCAGIKGLKIDDITPYYGKPYPFHFYPESFKTQMTGNMSKAKETGEVITQEAPVIDINGNEVWFHSTIVPVKDDNGRIEYLIIVSMDTTDRKQAEDTLRESHDLLYTTFDSLNDAFFILDDQAAIVECNRAATRIFGYRQEELQGQTTAFLHVDESALAEFRHQLYSAIEAGGRLDQFEFRMKRKDGTIFITEHSILPLTNVQGRRSGWVSVVRDITERKLVEERLRKSEEQNKAIVLSTPDHIIMNDKDLKYTLVVNPQLGLTEQNMLGKTDYDFLSKEDADKITMAKTRVIETGESLHFDTSLISASGKEEFFDGSYIPTFDAHAEPNGLIGYFRNVTERKQAEEKLRESEAIKNTMVSNIGDVIVIIDQNGINQYKSPNVTTLFGWQPEELVGRSTWENVYADDLDAARKFIATLTKEPNAKGTTELRYKRKDGKYVWIEITVVNLLSDPDINGLLGNYHDITERRLAEEELKSVKASLELCLEASQIGIWSHDITEDPEHIKQVSVRDLKHDQIFGYKEKIASWGQEKMLEHVIEEDREATRKAFDNVFEKGRLDFECRILWPDNTIHWIACGGKVYKDSAGQPNQINGTVMDITERKLAEQELIIAKEHAEESEKKLLKTNEEYRRSNQLLEESQSISKVGGWEFDMVNNKLYWTAETYRIHDTSPEEFNPTVNAGVSYFLPESKRLISEALEIAMKQGTGYDLILETYTTKGRRIDVRTTCQATIVDGKPVKLTGIFQDITERKQLENVHIFLSTSGYPGSNENFFESLAKYLAEILDSEYVCIDKLEGDGLTAQTVAIYNEGKFDPNVSYTLKQTPCGDVVGKTICCFPENVCQLFPQDEALQDLKAHSYIGTTLWSFDGKPIGLIAIIGQKPLKNAVFAENVLKLVAIRAAGELERMQAEEKLRLAKEKAEENEAYLISVLQSNNDIIVSRDLNNNVVFFNKAFDDITMELFNQHAYAGMNTLNLLPAEGRIFWENILQKVKNGETHEEEYSYKTLLKTADYITLHVPVLHGSKVVGTLEVTKDITAFKNREDELNLAKLHAEESDRLKSTFLANMSHEIRTPLNSIIGFSELLIDPDYDAEQKETFAGSIINNGNHLLEVISDIIDISKIESGQVILSKKKFNGQEIISEICDEFKLKALLKNIDLRIDPSTIDIDCMIESDRSKLKQVLINFVGNALKFTTEGSIEIGMKVSQSTVKFFVKDTGIGIPESLHGEVFERFRQLEDSSTRKYGGNGLGLTISKSLIELLGGTIGLDSEPGKGSTFYFTIPKNQ